MPAVNLREQTGGPLDWFNALPKLSRMYAGSLVCTAACIRFGIRAPIYLLLNWGEVASGLQIWRLFTHIFIAGAPSFKLLMDIIWILTYGTTLESSTYSIHPEDYLFLYVFAAVAMSVFSFVLGPLLGLGNITYTGGAIAMMLVYVWSKEFPHQDISLYGIIKIKGFWLPFAFLGISMFMGADIMGDSLGIVVGHIWYFYKTLLPRGTGRQYLPTPWFVRWAADKLALGPQAMRPAVSVTPPPAERAQAGQGNAGAQPGGFQAFRGPARRLGSS